MATLTGLNGPDALAFGPNGNLYVANDQSVGTVSEFAPGATAPTVTLTGLDYPQALAFDASGSLYVANFGDWGSGTTVSKFAAGATAPSATLAGLSGPVALAFDPAGNLYVANAYGNTVSEFTPGATLPSVVLGGLDYPQALAFDPSGNLYVANLTAGTVSEFAPGTVTPSATLGGLSQPWALAFDGSGNLYVANYSGTVSEFTPGATAPTTTLSGLTPPYSLNFVSWSAIPYALAFDSSGNLYVANLGNNTVNTFAPTGVPTAGGVVIRSSLPARPISIGGTNNAVAGINLTNAELAQIYTTASGTVTLGDSSQTGNITFTTATPVTTPGAATRIVQSSSGSGQIILDDAGNGTGLNGNGGTVTLTPGSGGIVTPLDAAGVPLSTQGFAASGLTLDLTLNFAPSPGTQLTLLDNTATPAASKPITGTLANLSQGGTISATYNGTPYLFRANYAGGDGNDLVLTAIAAVTATTTALSASQASATYGTQVTFTALVTAQSGSAAPSGSVQFFDGSTALGSGTAGTSGGLTQTWTFTTPNTTAGRLQVGAGQTITAVYTPTANFNGSTATLAGGETVTPVTLTVTGATAANKVYDATTAATLNLGSASLAGVLAGDAASLVSSGVAGTFASKNVASGLTVVVSGLSIGGQQAGDYLLNQPTLTANITARPLTVTAVSSTKVFDGTTSSTMAPTITGLASGDTASFAETFDTPSVGTAKTLTPAGSISDGNGGANYTLTIRNNTSGSITATTSVIDDGDPAWTTTGTWTSWTGQGYQNDVHQATLATPANATATWTFSGLSPNQYYKVETTWTKNTNRATNAPYTISGGAATLPIAVNQQQAPVGISANNWTWQELGVYEPTSGTLTVSLANNANGNVIADAVRIEPVPAAGPAIMVQVGTGSATDPVVLPTLSSTVQSIVSFAMSIQGTAPLQRTLRVFNGGGSPLTLSNLSVPAGFTLVSGFGANSVAPGGFTTFVLQPSTATWGTLSGTVTFQTSDSSVNPFSIPVTATVDPPPTATISNSGPIFAGSAATVSLGSPHDPSSADTTAGFHYSFALNEAALTGSYATAGTSSSAAFTFATAGTYTAWGRILDVNNAYTDYATQVTVSAQPAMSIINDGAAGWTTTGSWTTWTNQGYAGNDHEAATANSTATWTFTNLAAGNYLVYATWPANKNRATNVPYKITVGGSLAASVSVNQQNAPPTSVAGSGPTGSASNWYQLGSTSFAVAANGTLAVGVSNAGVKGYVEGDAVMLVQTQPELAAGGLGNNARATPLTASQATPLVRAAEARWAAAGANVSALGNVQISMANLPGTELSESSAAVDTIFLDASAKGYGWFIDSTPSQDSEFPVQVAKTEERASSGAAAGKMDLLTVIMHELGHLLGHPDLSPQTFPDDLMSSSLSAGLRRLPDSVAPTAARSAAPAQPSSPSSVAQRDAAKDAIFAALAQPPSAATADGSIPGGSNSWWLWYEEA